MVKLLRLKGDISRSNNEIVNTFRQPIILPAKSKIALAGIEATLYPTAPLPTSSVLTVNGIGINLVAGNYTIRDLPPYLESEIAFRCGVTAAESANKANNLAVSISPERVLSFQQETYSKTINHYQSDFAVISGNPTIDDVGGFQADGGVDDNIIISSEEVPNAGFRLETTVAGNDQVTYGVLNGPNATWFAAVKIDADPNYTVIHDDTEVDTGVAVDAAGSRWVITYAQNQIRFTIYSNAGAVIYNQTFAVTQAQWEANFSPNNCLVQVEAPAGSAAILTAGYSTLRGSGIVQSKLEISGSPSALLTFLGFHDQPVSVDAVEATITADFAVGTYNGLMITVDPFILESYDGAAAAQFQPNILYVLHDPTYQASHIALDVPELIWLDINNEGPINLNRIRARILDTATGDAVNFSKDPVMTILVE